MQDIPSNEGYVYPGWDKTMDAYEDDFLNNFPRISKCSEFSPQKRGHFNKREECLSG